MNEEKFREELKKRRYRLLRAIKEDLEDALYFINEYEDIALDLIDTEKNCSMTDKVFLFTMEMGDKIREIEMITDVTENEKC